MTRVALVVVGLAAGCFGLEQLLTVGAAAQVGNAVLWLAAVLVVHDGLFGPLAALAGRPLRGLGRRGAGWAAAAPVLGAGLWVAVVLTLLAVPALLSPGVTGNATVLPRAYGTGLGVLVAVDLVVTVAAAGLAAVRGRRALHPGLHGS